MDQQHRYFQELTATMAMLGQRPNTLFMGQAVKYPGTAMFRSLEGVPDSKKLELPVAEDMQLGMALGMSLEGVLPICIYPRINFLLLAINQLVLHLDKLPVYSNGGYMPKVIIRTAVATDQPLNPGAQHLGNFAHQLSQMLAYVRVVEVISPDKVMPAYERAARLAWSTLIVEYMDLY